MFSFFRRKPIPPAPSASAAPVTFNERVDAFWRWFREVAPRFYATIEARRSTSLGDEVSAKVDELLPGLAWVFGPGADGVGHSLTLSGEGVIHRQLLALHWLSRAPTLPGWTFYAARQPGSLEGQVIEIGGRRFDPAEIWLTPAVDAERENIDLTIWHPAWDQIEPRHRSGVTFLFLDEALGEYGTEWWIGHLEYGRDKLAGSFPLAELPAFVAKTAAERGWKKHAPGTRWTLYRFEESAGGFPRADTFTQSTCVPSLIRDYLDAAGDFDDPLRGFGADYVYVSIERSFFPPGGEVDRRGELEEAIAQALAPFGGGRFIGGAFGADRCYCDFLIFDGRRSLDAIQQALRAQRVPSGTMIEYFARDKRGQRIAL